MALVVNNNLMAANTARTLNAHYGNLASSTRRLSSGLRINSAADDAAGLAIRELMRADISSLYQGSRNANDAISMIQVADGSLSVIDEKLIRMKELAEQAATGTYDSTQRLMIDSEFHAMAAEIDRIANATDFNGTKLLDGSLAGDHDGSGLISTGKMKIHFGTANDSAEDYYYIEIGDCTTKGLGLWNIGSERTDIEVRPGGYVPFNKKGGAQANSYSYGSYPSGIVPMAYIPAGSTNVKITINSFSADDDIQIFTRDGYHLCGTKITDDAANDVVWQNNGVQGTANAPAFMTEANGFNAGASYKLPDQTFNSGEFNAGLDDNATKDDWKPTGGKTVAFDRGNGVMNITYNGDYDRVDSTTQTITNPDGTTTETEDFTTVNDGILSKNMEEVVTVDYAAEDLLIVIAGSGVFDIDVTWDSMPDVPVPEGQGDIVHVFQPAALIDIKTQNNAQQALERINSAIVEKDKIRANLGAMQNRLENTVTNLNMQAENLQASESRISDVDVATEMTNFVRNQILTQSAVAMLGQANSLPQMAMQLIGG